MTLVSRPTQETGVQGGEQGHFASDLKCVKRLSPNSFAWSRCTLTGAIMTLSPYWSLAA